MCVLSQSQDRIGRGRGPKLPAVEEEALFAKTICLITKLLGGDPVGVVVAAGLSCLFGMWSSRAKSIHSKYTRSTPKYSGSTQEVPLLRD